MYVCSTNVSKVYKWSKQQADLASIKHVSSASYASVAPAPATEILLPKRVFLDLGGLADDSSIVRLRLIALRVLLRPVFTSSSSSSLTLSSSGLYAAAS